MSEKEVFTVFAEVRRPRGPSDPGAAVEGCYITDGITVTLTDRQGAPVRNGDGKLYTRKLANGDSARTIAARMTKDFRLNLRGKDGRVSGFTGPISYPKFGVA